ncbi:DUF177 domain-containing protein [Qipengyuania sp. YG27]|uniref:DUF177 domain-containing protein n=1 Tax=Qipengyuania mesophila TaxID=2867246 RepID=A0ABS7JSM4_9SPHN|nr:DUF177 domain-containing protein [Qipengyuania mesophila]MBX7500593.1 DUF177 domain-containing protein [Qipengyuania mesophila]
MSAPELSRLIKTRALPAEPMVIEASEEERAALAKRFAVTSIPALTAKVEFGTKDEAVLANGTLTATIEQPCAVTREDLSYDVEEPLALRFVPAGSLPEHTPDEEIELDSEDLDEIEYEGDSFDLGEAIAQTLALAIDPYREGPGADEARRKAGITSDEEQASSGPLAEALKGLKK